MDAEDDRTPADEPLDWIAEVERSIREQDAQAFPVLPRVLRRVIRHELELSSPWLRVPHRLTYVINRDQLVWLVARDELGIDAGASLPGRMILLARPDGFSAARPQRPALLAAYWRLLYHARLDACLQSAVAKMKPAVVRARIDRIGQTQFDEIRAVLQHELMLTHPNDLGRVYAEFAAVYYELKHFAPELLRLYFPSLEDLPRVEAILREDCDPTALLEQTRPAELAGADPAHPLETPVVEQPIVSRPGAKVRRSAWRYRSLARASQKPAARGNLVRSALLWQQALAVAPKEEILPAQQAIDGHLDQLVTRLQHALELEPSETQRWARVLAPLLASSLDGYWNASARLLYDLQKVCIDVERETYRIDLWQWARSLGRQPLKTPLPNQRVVLISKHLRSAIGRLGSLRMNPDDRRDLQELLETAAHASERLLRKKLEPIMAEVLRESGVTPQNRAEEVSFLKIVAELLDGVVVRGFFTMGHLRDALSRNQVKMPDLAGAREFMAGDALLRADRQFAVALAGVYQPGPLYLRLLQRLSSLAFGTHWGRLFVKYIALPYGGAYVILEGVQHLVGPVMSWFADDEETHASSEPAPDAAPPTPAPDPTAPAVPDGGADVPATDVESFPLELPEVMTHHEETLHLTNLWTVLGSGTFLLVLLHVPRFRRGVVKFLRQAWTLLKWLLWDVPHWVFKQPLVQALMRSFPVMLFRRYLWTPLLVTLLVWQALVFFDVRAGNSVWAMIGVFIFSFLVLNSRMGRDTEELVTEWTGQAWHHFRARILIALFNFVLDSFRLLLDLLDRFLYAVDEWLRFRSGESPVTLGVKAVLGFLWSIITAVVRFCVTLLIEPQINPIKHFPVVTVSHKLILPLAVHLTPTVEPFLIPVFAPLLGPVAGRWMAASFPTIVAFCIPGVFGFLVWELKENWRLYRANRLLKLKPVIVGDHGESMLRLLKPGFHSGTVPKLFARRRRAARKARLHPERSREAKFVAQLHHVEESIRHFAERDLVQFLLSSPGWRSGPVEVGGVIVSTNRIEVELIHLGRAEKAWLFFAEQSGWLLAGLSEPGWISRLPAEERALVHNALAGFYHFGAADLVRQQLERSLGEPPFPYDIAANELVVWPDRTYESELHLSLKEHPAIVPRPRSLARAVGLEPIPSDQLVFEQRPIGWADWRDAWEHTAEPPLLLPDVQLLPERKDEPPA